MTEIAQNVNFSVFFNQESLEQLIQNILQDTARHGATYAEVGISMSKGFTVSVRMGEVETVEYNQDKTIEIIVYFGHRRGVASITDLRPESIQSAIQAACNIARFTDQDIYSGPPDKSLLAFGYQAPDLYYPWNLSVLEAIEIVKDCETKGLAQDKRIVNSEGATLATMEAWQAYGNSSGFIGVYPLTRHEISCALIAKQQEEMQQGYSYTVACDPSMLDSNDYLADEAVKRTINRLGARRIATCRAPVIFSAEQARGLLGHFVSAISGSSLYRKSSFLLDQLGQRIFPEHISLHEEPHLPKYLGSAPFDDDGVKTRNNVFIDQGILKSYSLGVYSARKLGMETTGNAGGVHNLFISTSHNDLTALCKKMDKGLLVTELMGSGVNLITGDYSRGVSGFWVEKGEIQYPVEEITIAGRLQNMYGNLVEVGNDIDKRGNIQTGSILLEEMMIAGS